MGGLFKSSPPPMPSLPPLAENTAAATEEKRRLGMIARKRRGRRGLIATSPVGLLALGDVSSQSKSLLGE